MPFSHCQKPLSVITADPFLLIPSTFKHHFFFKSPCIFVRVVSLVCILNISKIKIYHLVMLRQLTLIYVRKSYLLNKKGFTSQYTHLKGIFDGFFFCSGKYIFFFACNPIPYLNSTTTRLFH